MERTNGKKRKGRKGGGWVGHKRRRKEKSRQDERYFLREDVPHNVGMIELFEEGDLSDGGAGNTFFFTGKADSLQSHQLSCFLILCLPDNTVGSLTELIEALVLLHDEERPGRRDWRVFKGWSEVLKGSN